MLYCKDIINERLSQFFFVIMASGVNILAAVYRIDLSGTPCRERQAVKNKVTLVWFYVIDAICISLSFIARNMNHTIFF